MYLTIYRMPISLSVIMVLLTVLTFGLAYSSVCGDRKAFRVFRILAAAASVAWLLTVLYFLVIERVDTLDRSLNFRLFSHFRSFRKQNEPEYLRMDWMNSVLFVPFGLFFSSLFLSRRTAVLLTLTAGAVISIILETLQYLFYAGSFEADDILFNTIGTLVGTSYLLIIIFLSKRTEKHQ